MSGADDHEPTIRARRADLAAAETALDDAVRAAAADGIAGRTLSDWSGIARQTIRTRVLGRTT